MSSAEHILDWEISITTFTSSSAGQAGPGQTRGQRPWPVIREAARWSEGGGEPGPGPGGRGGGDKVCLGLVLVSVWCGDDIMPGELH